MANKKFSLLKFMALLNMIFLSSVTLNYAQQAEQKSVETKQQVDAKQPGQPAMRPPTPPRRPQLSGLYRAKVPCTAPMDLKAIPKGCESITYSLKFSANGEVEENCEYTGSTPKPPANQKGKFSFVNDSLIVVAFTDTLQNKYILKKKSFLLLLDKNKETIKGKLANQYIMRRVVDESQMQAALMNKKRRDGVTFYAASKEKQWSLDFFQKEKLIYKKTMRSLPDTFKISAWNENAERGVTNVEAMNKTSKKIVVNLYKQFCGDSLKGDKHTYKVMLTDSLETSGCGDELTPLPSMEQASLTNIWNLEKMGSVVIDKAKAKKIPALEINAKELSFKGNSGCNAINGTIKLDKNKITFDNVMASKMLCEGSIEPDFVAMLQKADTYIIARNRLMLRNKNEVIAVFVRVN